MIYSEILEEKYRVQAKLAAESTSIRDYLESSHREAQETAKKYGFKIKYANLPGTKLAMDKEAIQKAIKDAGRYNDHPTPSRQNPTNGAKSCPYDAR